MRPATNVVIRFPCWCCSAEQAREKYRNSSCYFVGPVLALPMNRSTVFAAALAQAVDQTTVQNPWALGAVVGGIQVSSTLSTFAGPLCSYQQMEVSLWVSEKSS